MSFDALAWAGKAKPGSAPRKLVLLALADRHNTEDGLAWPSIKWLSDWTDLNRKTIIIALQDLEAAGFIADSLVRKGATKQIKAYRLNIAEAMQHPFCKNISKESQKRDGLQSIPKTGRLNSTVFSREESQKRDTDTIIETVVIEANASTTVRAKLSNPDGVSDEQWNAFKAQRKKPLNSHAHTLLTNKLKALAEDGYPPGEMIDLAIERGWETVFKPREFNNGRPQQETTGIGRTKRAMAAACPAETEANYYRITQDDNK